MDRVKKIIESNEMVVHLETIEGIYWPVRLIRRYVDTRGVVDVLTNHFLELKKN